MRWQAPICERFPCGRSYFRGLGASAGSRVFERGPDSQKRAGKLVDAERHQRQVDSLRDYTRFARLRYENGYTSYIEVLDAERSLFSAELTYVQTQGTLFGALVNLYKAMGGGWVVEADKLTVSSSKKEQ